MSAAIWAHGLIALSDDDYARVTIAEKFATAPRFDPSGTSWLPFPFWIMGGAMKLLDPSLEVARLVTSLEALGATWLLFFAGRVWGFSDKRALAFAALATIVPAVAVLGSVMVPEFPTAALALFAIVAVTAPKHAAAPDRAPFLAVVALFAATLSRYEAWPIAAVLAVVIWKRQHGDRPARRAALAALALLGPAVWIANNKIAHGDAFSFLRRVSSYRAALGSKGGAGPLTYVVGLVGGSPAVMLVMALLVVASLRTSDREAARRRLARLRGWAACAAALLVFLLIGQLFGGAPTHHAERALLLVWLLATMAVVDLATSVRLPTWLGVPIAILLVINYRASLADPGARRETEERTGQKLRALVARGERAFAATNDYGYFAIMAAFGRPNDVAIDSQDPRVKSSTTLLRDPWNAVVRMHAENASWLVAPASVVFPLALQERVRDGNLVVYELAARR